MSKLRHRESWYSRTKKELEEMSYEKTYKEALGRARKQRADYQKELDKTDKNSQLAVLLRAGISAIELVFPELAETEDERIRKFLVDYFASYKIGNVTTKLNGVRIDDILNYLDKQKERRAYWELYKGVSESEWFKENYKGKSLGEEQPTEVPKEPHYTKRNELFDKCVKNCDPKVMKEVSDKVDEMLQKGQKPEWGEEDIKKIRSEEYTKGFNDAAFGGKLKEWSEEDENTIQEIIGCIEQARADSHLSEDHCLRLETFLYKHYRPSWKPGEEHLSALLAIFNDPNNIGSQTCQLALTDLYEQLKAIKEGKK